jgi:hypothetical protein
LWSFIGVNLAIFLSLFISKGFTGSSVEHLWPRVTAKNGIIAAIIPILAIVLSGPVSDLGKARLVFWRWHNPLPGCRVFTELISTDPRVDVPALTRKLGDLPKDPQAQNALWHRLYKEQKADYQDFQSPQELFVNQRHGYDFYPIRRVVLSQCYWGINKLEIHIALHCGAYRAIRARRLRSA